MTTKINADFESLPLSKNLAPIGITSGVVSYSAGVVAGDNVVTEIAAGTIAVPSYPYVVYVNTTTGLIAAAAESAVPIDNSVLLYRGDSQSHIEDLRSWTQHDGDIRSIVPTFVQTMDLLAADHIYAMDDTGTTITDTGNATTLVDYTATGTGFRSGGMKGRTVNESAVFLSISGGATLQASALADMFNTPSSTGSIVGMWQGARQDVTRSRVIFQGQTTTSHELQITQAATTEFLTVRIYGGADSYTLTHNVALDDLQVHWFAVVQDGVAVKVYLDGTDITGDMSVVATGTADATFWIDSFTGNFTASGMEIGHSGPSESETYIGPQGYWDAVALTATDITQLNDTLYTVFDDEMVSLDPEVWFKFNTLFASSYNTNHNYGVGTVDPRWVTTPVQGDEIGVPGPRATRQASRIKSEANYLRSTTTGISDGYTASSYGTFILSYQYDAGAGLDTHGPIFECYSAGNERMSLGTRRKTTSAEGNSHDAYLEWYTHTSGAGSTFEYTTKFEDNPINDGNWHLIYVVKNDDTAVPDVYLDGTLLVASSTVDGGSGDPDLWIDDFTDLFRMSYDGADLLSLCSYFITDFVYKDAGGVPADSVYTNWARDQLDTPLQAVHRLHADHLFLFNGTSSGTAVEDGAWGRHTGSAAAGVSLALVSVLGTPSRVTGPTADLWAMESLVNEGVYDGSGSGVTNYDLNTKGAVLVTWKCEDVGTVASRIYSAGNTANDYNHDIYISGTTSILTFRLRNTNSFRTEIELDIAGFTPDDDNWHICCWRANGTTWEIYVDGVWYTSADSEWTVSIDVGSVTEADWVEHLTTVDRITFGNIVGTGLSLGIIGEVGPSAIWEDDSLPSNACIEQFATIIGLT